MYSSSYKGKGFNYSYKGDGSSYPYGVKGINKGYYGGKMYGGKMNSYKGKGKGKGKGYCVSVFQAVLGVRFTTKSSLTMVIFLVL